MTPMEPAAASRAPPLSGLYGFVREHLVVANNVVLASGTLVAALDFMSPRLSVLPLMVYTATSALLLAMVAAAWAPALAGRVFGELGEGSAKPAGAAPMWRRPLWQCLAALLLLVSVIGFASVAKASQGGLLASRLPAARSLQEWLLGMERDVADIKQGVASANGKLDAIAERSKDPRRDLVSRGYSVDDSGLSKAIRQGDAEAARLFGAAGFKASHESPMANILTGPQPWSPELAAALDKSLFSIPSSCEGQSNMLLHELPPPAAERVATFKRLCGGEAIVGRLRSAIAEDESKPISDYYTASARAYQDKQRTARRENLAALR